MKQSGFGIASLTLGIIGMILSILLIGIVPCSLAVIFAIIALCKKDRKHGTAIAGLICSLIGIAIFIWIIKPNPAPQVTNMELGKQETINNIIEFTPEKGRWEGIIHPSKSSSMSYSHTIEEGEMPYLFTGTLKYLGNKETTLDRLIDAVIIINDQYEFDAEVEIETKDGTDFDWSIQPLQERLCYIHAGIPYEIYDVFEYCTIKFSVSKSEDGVANVQYDDHIYMITFDKENSKTIQ